MTDCQVTVKVTKPKKEENLSDEGWRKINTLHAFQKEKESSWILHNQTNLEMKWNKKKITDGSVLKTFRKWGVCVCVCKHDTEALKYQNWYHPNKLLPQTEA